MALAMGIRQGEALGARWADVDLGVGTWRVAQGLQRKAYRHGCGAAPCGNKPLTCPQRTGGLLFVEPKSEKGKRTIGIPSQLVVALRAHRQAQREERMAAGSLWQDLGLVFASPTGGKTDPRRDWGEWKSILQAAGVRDARLHDARHTGRHAPARAGRRRPRRHGDPRPLPDLADPEHLAARDAEGDRRRDRTDRRSAVRARCNHRCAIREGVIRRRSAFTQVSRYKCVLPRLDLNQEPCD